MVAFDIKNHYYKAALYEASKDMWSAWEICAFDILLQTVSFWTLEKLMKVLLYISWDGNYISTNFELLFKDVE